VFNIPYLNIRIKGIPGEESWKEDHGGKNIIK
jgi:hypothetical protein